MTEHVHGEISPLGSELTDEVLDIMRLANEVTVQKSGDRLWTTDVATDSFREQIELGNCYAIYEADGTVAATIILQEDDEWTWGEKGLDGQALYFHKLIKNPATQQQNLGERMLNFAATEALRRQKDALRCDTKPTMAALVRFYEKCGFVNLGVFHYVHTGLEGVYLEANPIDVIDRTQQL